MNKLLLSKNLLYYCLLLIVITIPLKMMINNIAIIIFSFFAFVDIIRSKRQFNFTKLHYLFISYFVLSVISLIYTCNISYGFKNLEKYLSFLILPIFMSRMKISKNHLNKILLLFAITTLMMFLMALIIAIYNTLEAKSFIFYNPINKVDENFFLYHRLSNNIGFHAIYLAVFMVFSNTIFIVNLITCHKRTLKLFLFTAIVFTSVGIVMLQSFSVLFSQVIIFLFFLFFYYNKLTFNWKILISSIGLFILFFSIKTFVKKADGFNTKIFNYNFSHDIDNKNWNSLNIRLAKWQCAIEVAKDNLPIGTGVGCQQIQLNSKYSEKGFVIGMNKKFSTHNQYFHSLIQLGVIGLILLLSIYLYGLYLAIKNKNLVFLTLMILLIFTSITENVLTINKGIVFFTFFIILINTNQSINNNHIK